MSKAKEILDGLSTKEKLELVQELLKDSVSEEPKPKRRRRKKKLEQAEGQATIEQPRKSGRRQKKKNFDLEQHRESRRKTKRGNAGYIEAIDTSGNRENKFLNDSARNAHKDDAKIDEILSKNKQPTQRRATVELIEIQCSGPCREWFDIYPHQVYRDPEKGNVFYCNDCSTKAKE